MSIEAKFNKIRYKGEFYATVATECGKEVDSVSINWFNRKRGIKIPEKYEKTVDAILDHRLKYEQLAKELELRFKKFKR